MTDKDSKPEDDGIEPWITVQLTPPAPGGYFAAFILSSPEGTTVVTKPIAWFALQHLAFEEDGVEEVESRIVPVVLDPDGSAVILDAGQSGGPDHGFAGLAQSAAEAERIGRAVVGELERQAAEQKEPQP